MSKTEDAAEVHPSEFALTADEWCARLSAGDKRVELITAFAASERRAGRVKDSEENFANRFAAFCGAAQ